MPSPALARIARNAALSEADALVGALSALTPPFAEAAAALRYHHLAALVLAAIDETGIRARADPTLVQAIERSRPLLTLTAEALIHGFTEIRGALEAAHVPVIFLKGLYFAERLYGGYARRPQFDLDLLVRTRDRGAAARALARAGFTRQAYDLHSQTFVRAGLKVDVHDCLRRAPAYRVPEQTIWQTARDVRVGGIDARTLSDEYTLVFLGLAAFEDLGQGMVRLKQLLDMFLLLRLIDPSCDWDNFFERRVTEGIDGVLANVLALVLDVFEGATDVPRLNAALVARRHLLAGLSPAEAATLALAPRKNPASLAWFSRVYPGSFVRYLAAFWIGGFPANLRQLRPSRLAPLMRAGFVRPAASRSRTRSMPAPPAEGERLSTLDAEMAGK
jgi:hypothetical protein